MILVTGGAGFIGANFVLDWLASSNEPVVNLDALTYAGQPAEPGVAAGQRPPRLRARRHHRPCAARQPLRHVHRPAPSCTLLPRVTSTAASTDRRRSCARTSRARSRCSKPRATLERAAGGRAGVRSASTTSPPTRSTALLTRDRAGVHRVPSVRAEQPVFGEQGAAADHLVRAWHHTYGLPVLTTNCSNNYGPLHFPEKLIPLMIVNALRAVRCRSTAMA